MKTDITQARLKEVLRYYPITGNFRWTVFSNHKKRLLGKIAGSSPSHNNRYIKIKINGIIYAAHRLAFLYIKGYFPEYPKYEIDHEDHNRANNRWLNLSLSNKINNQRNASRRKDNKSGYSGVIFHKLYDRWYVQISVKGKRIRLGSFKNKKEAIKVRKKAEKKYGYHPNHGKRKRVQLVGV